jgi:uncharacterized BrkB/YihY/UPF0761 family membrane protein
MITKYIKTILFFIVWIFFSFLLFSIGRSSVAWIFQPDLNFYSNEFIKYWNLYNFNICKNILIGLIFIILIFTCIFFFRLCKKENTK